MHEAYLDMRTATNDGVLYMTAFFHNDIIHDNRADNFDTVAQLAGGANDGSLHAAPITKDSALGHNAAG